jgi:hypothetical protein
MIAGAVRRFVAALITIRRFRLSSSKQEMVSWRDRIVSSLWLDETIAGKSEFRVNAIKLESLLKPYALGHWTSHGIA